MHPGPLAWGLRCTSWARPQPFQRNPYQRGAELRVEVVFFFFFFSGIFLLSPHYSLPSSGVWSRIFTKAPPQSFFALGVWDTVSGAFFQGRPLACILPCSWDLRLPHSKAGSTWFHRPSWIAGIMSKCHHAWLKKPFGTGAWTQGLHLESLHHPFLW
jgi:hypothetical protein